MESIMDEPEDEKGMSWKDVRLYFLINILFACGKFQVYHIYVANNAQVTDHSGLGW